MTSNIFNDISQSTKAAQSYTSAPTTVKVSDVMPSIPAASTMDTDKVDLTSAQKPKEKRGPIKAIKGFIANVKKSVATFNEYTKGVFKGLKNGAILGSLIYTAGAIINHFRTKAIEGAKKLPNRALAVVGAIAAVAANIWIASLNASDKRSDIDHRWTGHEGK